MCREIGQASSFSGWNMFLESGGVAGVARRSPEHDSSPWHAWGFVNGGGEREWSWRRTCWGQDCVT